MVHPLFTQHNGDLGNRLNVMRPAEDAGSHRPAIAEVVAAVAGAYGTVKGRG